MDEFKYVMKCFLFAGLVMTFSQAESEGVTWESKAEIFLTESKAAHFMQDAAMGGAKVLKEAFIYTKNFISEKMSSSATSKSFRNEDSI